MTLHSVNNKDYVIPIDRQFIEVVVADVLCSLFGNRFDYKCVVNRRWW